MLIDPAGFDAISNFAFAIDITLFVIGWVNPWVKAWKAPILAFQAIRVGLALYTIHRANQVLRSDPRNVNARYDKYFGYVALV